MTLHIPCVDAQVNFGELCDRAVETGEAVIITRPDEKKCCSGFRGRITKFVRNTGFIAIACECGSFNDSVRAIENGNGGTTGNP